MRTCSRCKETKPLSGFYKDSTSKTGYRHTCKDCHRVTVELGRSQDTAKKKQYLDEAVARENQRHEEALRKINEKYNNGGK